MKATIRICQKNCLIDQLFRSISLRKFVGMYSNLRFWPVRKIAKAIHHVCPCVRMKQLGFHWTDFRKILYLTIFRKFIEKIRVPLKSVKENAHFTWSPLYIFYHISLNSSRNEKFFKQKLQVQSKHKILCSKTIFEKCTNTYSEYVILIAFPLQLWLNQRASVLCYTYIACLVAVTIKFINFDCEFCFVTFIRSRRKNFSLCLQI